MVLLLCLPGAGIMGLYHHAWLSVLPSSTCTYQNSHIIFRIALYSSFHKHHQEPLLILLRPQGENIITILGSPSSLWYSFYSVSSIGKYLNLPIDMQLSPHLVSLRAIMVNFYLHSLNTIFLVGYLYSSQLTDGLCCPIKLFKHIEPKHAPVGWPESCHFHPTTYSILRFKVGLFQDDNLLRVTGLLHIMNFPVCKNLHPIFLWNTLSHTPSLVVLHAQLHMRQDPFFRAVYQTLCLPLPQQDCGEKQSLLHLEAPEH